MCMVLVCADELENFSSGVFQIFPVSGISFFNLRPCPAILDLQPSLQFCFSAFCRSPHIPTQGTWGSLGGGIAPLGSLSEPRMTQHLPLLGLYVVVAEFHD